MTLLVALAILAITFQPGDPAPGMTRNKAASRRLECERSTTEATELTHPGTVVTTPPRGDWVERSAVVCTERLLRPGLRSPREEAILASLDELTVGLAVAAAATRPELAGRTWLVEAHDPSVLLLDKIGFAAKNALVRQGLRVSDRKPTLAAGDLDVLTRLAPTAAYAAACGRYHANGSLREDDVLLAIVSRDPRETVLHGGLCVRGSWAWLL